MPNCLIFQPAGIGDIFFLQKMATFYQSAGYEVYMPVYDHLVWLQDYMPSVNIVSVNDDFPMRECCDGTGTTTFSNGDLFIGTHTADITNNDGRIMSSKYSMVGLDCRDWADFFSFRRFKDKENRLMELLGLSEDSRYIVQSTLCGTPPHHMVDFGEIPINNPDNLPIVNMHIIHGFTIFDWCKVLENAERIFMVNTSTNYILEKLELKAKEYVIYAKNPGNLYQIDYLFKKGELRCL